ncbi:MAG: hypothetical protein AAF518_04145 [Spirochaetota bacterium]
MKNNTYQINPETARSLSLQHPWIYRKHISKDVQWKDGSIVSLYFQNVLYGTAVYSQKGMIALRVFAYRKQKLQASYLRQKVSQAVAKRLSLLTQTNSIRWIHGENDSLPGITIDTHNNLMVLMVYTPALVCLGRYLAQVLRQKLKAEKIRTKYILLKAPRRMGENSLAKNQRMLRGKEHIGLVEIKYQGQNYLIDPHTGKGGTYNDIRNLRNYILENTELFQGKRCLNLFSNNGILAHCLVRAGAEKVYSLEDSSKSIAVHKRNIEEQQCKKQIVLKKNIFRELGESLEEMQDTFGVAVIDPPNLTASQRDKAKARKIYASLISQVIPSLQEESVVILCSCSSRIHEKDFLRICVNTWKEHGIKYKLLRQLQPEIDHPTKDSFPEGKYFKVHIYRIQK